MKTVLVAVSMCLGFAFNAAAQWIGTNPPIFYNGGNVGIGTTDPKGRLSVGAGTGTKFFLYDDPGLSFNYRSGFGMNLRNPGLSTSMDFFLGYGAGTDIEFNIVKANQAWPFTSYTSLLAIKGTGNVGIGITEPAAKLDVNGNVNVTGNITMTGNINAKYQDVAEWVPVSETMPPGTVVVVSGTTSNTVGPSARAYDTRVAGVVSARPGILLGEPSVTKAQIATTGRVKVRVDATKHAIAMGDLLVTSDSTGAAMYSEPLDLGGVKIHRPGTLIGKALEPLPGGQGEILVLLSLQ